jgi:hypothetical protein
MLAMVVPTVSALLVSKLLKGAMPRRKSMTAGELMRQLEADPQWVTRRDECERLRKQKEAELRRDEAPLVAELQSVGLNVRSAWDLVNTAARYPTAIPILLAHLERTYHDAIREGIARALAVREARNLAWDKILDMVSTQWGDLKERVRDGLMVALCGMARPSDLPTLISLISNPRFGAARVLLVRNLMRSRKPEAREALERLRGDPDLEKEIAARLRPACLT